MSKKEMDEVNNKSEELDLRVIQEPKFEGSCLVISTDLIKVNNIPHGSLMVRDTGTRVLGYIWDNIIFSS